jgi:hypothetical protein
MALGSRERAPIPTRRYLPIENDGTDGRRREDVHSVLAQTALGFHLGSASVV